jgi:hypothetical protein
VSIAIHSKAVSWLTLVRIIQSIATLVVGLSIGFAYAWQTALVGMGASHFPILLISHLIIT